MKSLVVLFALVALAAADCNDLNRLKVKAQWNQIYGVNTKRTGFGLVMWKALFGQDPEARGVFDRVNGDDIESPEFKAHSARVFGGLDIAISLLDQQDVLDGALAHLHEQHVERGIPARYFDAFKKALMAVGPAALGRCWDAEAWSDCFDVIANGIKE